ncbi:MAG TPA: hypothetical protein DCY48_03995 [Candidatus Magasanikbacteria bacterium]|nr:MAG: hypothetical protein A3I74_00450 [Candidatus Magasanikbacteria bacterium RIFCSPLOWO2_02_FULL_47_16]OGH80079.1 MAG: hypothetical protein A3C10_02775 [Candidatus Magasanikbacteria bacterium RIFCSPHIGHO2_02_FULL_48_18]OGH83336.1 MAG: hypothetical protein A3G08_00325 [Candidatus Magasanikbacteria bacterium RIFCSPLOWO2_12_FULL_47_9b]HAZ28906.1 hypothetical protein [Candidatus Magasanikbacteria bacterium]
MTINLKRAIGFGILLWVFIFVVISILMFLPGLKDNETRIYFGWWLAEIPVVFLTAKWYFKQDPPSIQKGIMLGIVAIIVGSLLDSLITVPLFVHSYAEFFGDWRLYVGLLEMLVLTTAAGFEYDRTYTKREQT